MLFAHRIDLGLVENNAIDEASGIISSKNNSNLVWVHNDSGDRSRIYAVGLDGSHLGMITLNGIGARDWEDISIGPGPKEGVDYIYIGDIGDNFSIKEKKNIYRFEEPVIDFNSIQIPFDIQINMVESITYIYPDGKWDAESLMIDPISKDLYVLTKRESPIRVYRLPFPQSISSDVTAEYVGNFSLPPKGKYPSSDWVSSADISRDGRRVLIKTYDNIYLLEKEPNEALGSVLSANKTPIEYIPEPQGESVCWEWNNKGYYTISEEIRGIPAHLYYYHFTD